MPETKKRFALFPKEYDEVSLVDSGAGEGVDVLIFKARGKQKPRSSTNACSTEENPTGAKETDPAKKSERGKKWKEKRHKRSKEGKFDKTSSESKSKYGKGGTTQEELDAKCGTRKKKRSNKAGAQNQERNSRDTNVRKGRRQSSSIRKWSADARLNSILERK
jgi:hypothetical protein